MHEVLDSIPGTDRKKNTSRRCTSGLQRKQLPRSWQQVGTRAQLGPTELFSDTQIKTGLKHSQLFWDQLNSRQNETYQTCVAPPKYSHRAQGAAKCHQS